MRLQQVTPPLMASLDDYVKGRNGVI